MTMKAASLELKLTHHEGDQYVVDARFFPAGSAEVKPPDGGPFLIHLDTNLLRELYLDLPGYGQQLTRMLFADSRLGHFFAIARSNASGAQSPLRVRLWLDRQHPELHRIRWETLQDPGSEHPMFLFPNSSVLFSRYVDDPSMEQVPPASLAAIRALIVIANPTDLAASNRAPIDVAQEHERVAQALGAIPQHILATDGDRACVTLSALTEKLQEGHGILYLVCHGIMHDEKPYVLLQRKDGRTHPVATESIVQHISSLSPEKRPRLIVLATCASAGQSQGTTNPLLALGPTLAQKGIGAVLAMSDHIPMATVAAGMPIFFRQLQEHGYVDRALAEARNVLIADDQAWWQLVLFSRLPDGQLWVAPEPAPLAARNSVEQGSAPPAHPALRQRLIQPLDFQTSSVTTDYYEGKHARADHIAAQLDAPRPQWQQAIKAVLQRAQVCVIRSSSGQGKSTLLYRYAYTHRESHRLVRMHRCATAEHVSDILDYLNSPENADTRPLILIDHLDQRTLAWHEVAAALAGTSVRFLVTSREEDWYRYGRGTSGFSWEVVKPQLSFQEASKVYAYFQKHHKIAPGVRSARWAYDQVAEQKLLIEFVYLITHGRMLAERIQDQVQVLEQEDQGKLEVLRLVSTAHIYSARIQEQTLLNQISFRGDSHLALRSLEGEYLTRYDDEIEGLHAVRSQHLVTALHTQGSVMDSIIRLIQLLDQPNLITLITHVFAEDKPGNSELVKTLVERCREQPITAIHEIVEALFTASELRYFQAHKHLFDEAMDQLGYWAVDLLASSTLPVEGVNFIETLSELLQGRINDTQLRGIQARFATREAIGSRQYLREFLAGVAQIVDPTRPGESLAAIADLSLWYQFVNLPTPNFRAFFQSVAWEEHIGEVPGEQVSHFLQALYQQTPERYASLIDTQKMLLYRKFRIDFEVLSIEEPDNDIAITFIVDLRSDAPSPNDQAVSRLQQLWNWFPDKAQYRSQGLDIRTGAKPLPPDDTHKEMANATLRQRTYVSKNALYKRLIKDRHTTDTLDDWLKQWKHMRTHWLSLVESLINVYERYYRQRNPNLASMKKLALEALQDYPKLLNLPARLQDEFRAQERTITSWSNSFHTFIRQYLQHNPQEGNHDAFLMRINLKDVTHKLDSMHQAFEGFFAATADDVGMRQLNDQEARSLTFLIDILDYWFTEPSRSAPNLRYAIRQWREQTRSSEMAAVRASLAPLAEAGMAFVYPTALLKIDSMLIGLCVGYEIYDFSAQLSQVARVCRYLADLDLTYSFLYLVPTIQGHLQGSIIRVSRDTVRRLLEHEPIDQAFPVSPPEGLEHVLPGISLTPLPDTLLVGKAGEAISRLVMERNRSYFARSSLQIASPEDSQLLKKYEQLAQGGVQQALIAFRSSYEEAQQLDMPDFAAGAWQELWEAIRSRVEALSDFSDIPNAHTPTSVMEASPVDPLFFAYLNARHHKGPHAPHE